MSRYLPSSGALSGAGGPGADTVLVYHDQAVVEQTIVSAVPVRLQQLRAILDAPVVADRFAQVFNSAAGIIAPGSEPVWEGLVPGANTSATQYAEMSEDWQPIGGLVLSVGLTLVCSLTPGIYASPGADEMFFEATYELI
jgi:hypothetical protein